MKVRDVYETALAFLAEKGGSCVEYDFEERAPFIIAAAAAEAETLDREYRRSYGAENQENSENDNDGGMNSGSTLMFARPVRLSLDSEFPLCDRFASVAAYFTAAMLIAGQNADLYDFFFDKWCDALATIAAGLPGKSGSTRDVYPYI
ncbi:MAG: hypothetical protein MJ102_04690 [Clostridia bacterium]|nr:hypothetical protein [Clostridia bacterium]